MTALALKLPAANIKRLGILATEIDSKFSEANQHANQAIDLYLQVGRSLAEARFLLPGDLEFGRWRAENTTISKEWASRLMAITRKWGGLPTPPPGLTISAMAELTHAPEELVTQAIDRAEEGDPMTIKEIRSAKSSTRVPASSDPSPSADVDTPDATDTPESEPPTPEQMGTLPMDQEPESAPTKPVPTVKSFSDVVNSPIPPGPGADPLIEEEARYLALSLPDRLRKKGLSPWVKFGLSQFFENPPNPDVIEILYQAYNSQVELPLIPLVKSTYNELRKEMGI